MALATRVLVSSKRLACLPLLKEGDRVGWGYEHDSCSHCEQCLKGTETYCPERKMYGYADVTRVLSLLTVSGARPSSSRSPTAFPMRLPLLSSAVVPPSSTLSTCNNTQPTDRVGIVGVGGLGHLASSSPPRWDAKSSSSLAPTPRRMRP